MRTRGYIDGIFGAAVRGWVVDLDDPATALHVVVRLDGQEFAAVTADEPRADLARAGIGSGLGGFRVHIGNPPAPGAHEIVALVAGTDTAVPIAKDVRLLDAADAPRTDLELYEGRYPAPASPHSPDQDAEQPNGAPGIDVPRRAPSPPAGDPALAGEMGWLFRCPARGFELVRGVVAPDRESLEELVARIEQFASAAVDRGAICLIAVLPDKLHVYPEQAPATMAMYPAGRVAEHLAARVQDTDDVLLIDLLPTLLRARAHGRVFSRAGTGPTWLGAFHAYRAIAKQLAVALPAMRPRAADALVLGADEPVSDAPRDGPLLHWHDGALVPDGTPIGLATTAVEPSLGAGFGRDVGGHAAPAALLVHDAPSRRVAELLADHCAGAPLIEETALAGQLDGRDPDVAVWLVSDQSLAALVGRHHPDSTRST